MSKEQTIISPNGELNGIYNDNTKKHVIILGNGFDLFLNRETSFADYYNSAFCPKDYPAPLIYFLNDSCGAEKAKYIRWFDFENELLNYFEETIKPNLNLDVDLIDETQPIRIYGNPISQKEEKLIKLLVQQKSLFKDQIESFGSEIFGDLLNRGLLVQNEDDSYRFKYEEFTANVAKRDKYAFNLIKESLSYYLSLQFEEYPKEQQIYLQNTVLKKRNNEDIVLYTFNYTKIPSIVELVRKNIHYVHGSCEKNDIILGTREHKEMPKEYWFLQKTFDANYKPPYVASDLLDANIVSIFGHSLGENDSAYFKEFFMRNCKPTIKTDKTEINIYTKDAESVADIKHSLQVLTEFHLSDLNQYSNLNIYTTENLQSETQPIQ